MRRERSVTSGILCPHSGSVAATRGTRGEDGENRDAADNLTVNHVLVHFPFHSFRSLCRSITAPRVKREVNEVKDESNEWIGSGNE